MMKKKWILSIIAIVCTVVCSVAATLAYVMAISNSVENTFTIGKIEITLSESTGSHYALIPGATVKKDPKVTVKKGSEDCWLFVKLEKKNNVDAYLTYSIGDGWFALSGVSDVYYRQLEQIDADISFSILKNDEFTVTHTLTKTKMTI